MGNLIRLDHYRASFFVRKPKALRRVSKPRRFSSSQNVKKWRGGMKPTDNQCETAGGLTPANLAAAEGPPTALTTEYALSSMEPAYSNDLNVSRAQNTLVDGLKDSKFHAAMAIDRDAVIRRLNLLPDVLGKNHTEIAELIGCSVSTWANWRSPTGTVSIQPEAAAELYRVFDISMDWVYAGEIGQIRNQTLRERIVMAEHKRNEELAEAAAKLNKGADKLERGAKKLDKAATKLDKAVSAKKKRSGL